MDITVQYTSKAWRFRVSILTGMDYGLTTVVSLHLQTTQLIKENKIAIRTQFQWLHFIERLREVQFL